ncbi:ribonuclease H-like domain-containing protein [Tanacetum coccineum]
MPWHKPGLKNMALTIFSKAQFFSFNNSLVGVSRVINLCLILDVIPDVRTAYATISSEESHRVAAGSIDGSSQRNQASAFVSNVPNRNNFQRNQTSGFTQRNQVFGFSQNLNSGPRPNNMNNNRQGGGSGLVCKNCDFNGHTIDRCFKIIGYPADFGKKKSNQSFKGKNISNNNSVRTSSSSGFTDEQMATLISLIKDNKVGKNVQANMAGHPNGTKAYISKIGNLKLSNGLTLYDVMVIPEYYVTLIYVHKLAKENKVIVAFDENRCYFLNQDLSLKNVLGIGDQCERLGHPAEPDSEIKKNDSNNVLQDVNHMNFFDIEYPEIPNDDERVENDLNRKNKSQSDSSSSSMSSSNHNTVDFPVDNPRNDVDSSDEFVPTQNEGLPLLKKCVGQKERIDYEETFSHVVKMATVRCLLNIVVSMSWHVYQLDVNNAFLYGDLEEVVYMKPPKGYFPSDNKAYRLRKSLYGLKQAPRQWNAKLTSTLIENGFSQNLGKLKYFFGIEEIDTDKGICFNKRKYVLDLLSEYGMLACKPAKTPFMSKLVISNKASDKDPLLKNITDYQKLMGKLIYLTNTRPYISYVEHCLSQFKHSPLNSLLKIAFKILRYLKSCPCLGIHITKTSGMFLNAYSDADWAKCIITRKSITSKSTIKIAANLLFHERTKHLENDLHFVREKILNGVVKTVKVDSANQIADILTKGLDTIQHYELVKKTGANDIILHLSSGGTNSLLTTSVVDAASHHFQE